MAARGGTASPHGGPAPVNLPLHLTTFVGREFEQEEVLRLLHRTRLVTCTGTGGCGKTRLATRVAAAAAARFPDGTWWVELAPIGDGDLVGPAVAQVLGVRPLPGQTELDAVLAYLERRQSLLVVDNCEHLLDEAARLAEAVGRACPGVRLLATSREPLRAQGETEWRVPSLSLPGDDTAVDVAASDAVRLFVERAAQVKPSFQLTDDNARAVVGICRGLDGIPLAIELAAARMRAFSVEQIAEGLADRFRFLAAGPRTAAPRQQTLRASVDWSHDLLSEPERIVFRRLAVFVGGFALEPAERVCGGEGVERDDVLGMLAALVEKSLVQAEDAGAVVRYRLLETIRQYARERLDDADEAERVRDRHRDVFLEMAESIFPELLTPHQPEALSRLDSEAANLEHAIERAASTAPQSALRMCVALTLWWRLRSRFAQGETSFRRALEATPEPSVMRARALWGRAFLFTFGGALDAAFPAAFAAVDAAEEAADDSTTARALWLIGMATMWIDPIGARPGLERARDLAAGSGDDFGLMHATQGLGMTYSLQSDHAGARAFHDESFRLAQGTGQQDALAWHWLAMALSAWTAGDLAALRVNADRALLLSRRVGDVVTETAAVFGLSVADIEAGRPQRAMDDLGAVVDRALARGGMMMVGAAELGLAIAKAADGRLDDARAALVSLIAHRAAGLAYIVGRAYAVLGEVNRLLGNRDAQNTAEAGLEIANRSGDRPVAAEAQLVLGRVASAAGEWTKAQRLFHEILPVAVESGSPRVPRVLEALAETAAGLESPTEAARVLGAASRAWSELGLVPWPHQRRETDRLEDHLRELLGADSFERAHAEGRALAIDEAVGYVRRARGERKRPSIGWASLTPTEVDVARHAAAGLTNPEIAEQMFISRGTVRTHLSHIFAKVGVKNRLELATEMARRPGDTQS